MATEPASKSGRLSLEELLELIRTGEIETVVTVFPDMYGRLVGKEPAGNPFSNEATVHVGEHRHDSLDLLGANQLQELSARESSGL